MHSFYRKRILLFAKASLVEEYGEIKESVYRVYKSVYKIFKSIKYQNMIHKL